MQQTAVEWLVKELNLEGYDHTVEQAKKLEQTQKELSNRYIEQYAYQAFGKFNYLEYQEAFIKGAEWYRRQITK
jgi:hypothetical protein